ncbi:hypothetical protein [Parasphaerochaeta coccoides]|uniref:Uncharacterized protein n=1 Tax=Parasphaerochaeta coccoides (strain ATCC BAA-1237 / DSM 17374 / SPN1) TaxID=760011 RepID=F4GH20_PARC1|nr:hypothetical protein [Parasphaerochaeta coccoides]AEC01495.1 hypothetical protein Spico_0265 [Parasphaerochaeta coccoides DSM 17374]
MKKAAEIGESLFELLYLASAFTIGMVLLLTSEAPGIRMLAGSMALVLVAGDAFHLIPRIVAVKHGSAAMQKALGRGRQIASISMTLFYLFLWHIGHRVALLPANEGWTLTVYSLALVRIALCFASGNGWTAASPSFGWSIARNIPFLMLGGIVAIWYFLHRNEMVGLGHMYIAIIISFLCYLPVVVFSLKYPKIGMLMLPKSLMYLWMLVMCLSL